MFLMKISKINQKMQRRKIPQLKKHVSRKSAKASVEGSLDSRQRAISLRVGALGKKKKRKAQGREINPTRAVFLLIMYLYIPFSVSANKCRARVNAPIQRGGAGAAQTRVCFSKWLSRQGRVLTKCIVGADKRAHCTATNDAERGDCRMFNVSSRCNPNSRKNLAGEFYLKRAGKNLRAAAPRLAWKTVLFLSTINCELLPRKKQATT